jgi:DNA primase
MDEAKHDPIKKADLIRDMVLSISKIPDRIKREIYIQETSRIMDISSRSCSIRSHSLSKRLKRGR